MHSYSEPFVNGRKRILSGGKTTSGAKKAVAYLCGNVPQMYEYR
ncbi:hypothetical protein [Mucilaginibacter mallensis]|nr:hypothetical protein [Mucilaginibacter mallensis]